MFGVSDFVRDITVQVIWNPGFWLAEPKELRPMALALLWAANPLKKTGQLRNVWVEFGFGTVCWVTMTASLKYTCVQCTSDIREQWTHRNNPLSLCWNYCSHLPTWGLQKKTMSAILKCFCTCRISTFPGCFVWHRQMATEMEGLFWQSYLSNHFWSVLYFLSKVVVK